MKAKILAIAALEKAPPPKKRRPIEQLDSLSGAYSKTLTVRVDAAARF